MVVQQIITNIAVSLNASSQQHTLDVTFNEKYWGWFAARSEKQTTSETTRETTSDPSESFCEARVITQGDMNGEDAAVLLASPGNTDQLFNHGRVTQKGPAAQRSSQNPQNSHSVHIGPLSLSVRPLSEYQQSLITRILSLRSRGWSDHHIAKHFNDSGFLTPRGCSWVPQSVFSIRRKYQRRLARIGGEDGKR